MLQVVLLNLIEEHDTAIRGVLWATRGPWFTLREASIIRPGLPAVPIDGETIVHQSNVAFIQVLPP